MLVGLRRPIMDMITGRAPPPHRAESQLIKGSVATLPPDFHRVWPFWKGVLRAYAYCS